MVQCSLLAFAVNPPQAGAVRTYVQPLPLRRDQSETPIHVQSVKFPPDLPAALGIEPGDLASTVCQTPHPGRPERSGPRPLGRPAALLPQDQAHRQCAFRASSAVRSLVESSTWWKSSGWRGPRVVGLEMRRATVNIRRLYPRMQFACH